MTRPDGGSRQARRGRRSCSGWCTADPPSRGGFARQTCRLAGVSRGRSADSTPIRPWPGRIKVHSNDPARLVFPIRGMYLDAINRARSHIYLTNAYFIPDRVILSALVAAAVPLAPVEVRGERAVSPALRGFEARRAHGNGYFFNRQEITRMQARVFTDVLRRVPGVNVQPISGPHGSGDVVRMSRTIGVMGARACPVLYYMNGTPFPVTGDVPINTYIVPEDVAAIEIYNGMSQIPPEFSSSLHNARCGVIVIWTLNSIEDSTSSP